MQNLLLEVWRALPRTVLFVTHDVEEALLLADTVYVMTAESGCGRADGALIKSCPLRPV